MSFLDNATQHYRSLLSDVPEEQRDTFFKGIETIHAPGAPKRSFLPTANEVLNAGQKAQWEEKHPSRSLIGDVANKLGRGTWGIFQTIDKALIGLDEAIDHHIMPEPENDPNNFDLKMYLRGQEKKAETFKERFMPLSREHLIARQKMQSEETPWYKPNRSWVEGVESFTTSMGTMVPAIALATVGGAGAGIASAIGLASQIPLFGAAQYADALEKYQKKGLTREEADVPSRLEAASEMGTEFLSDIITAWTLGLAKVAKPILTDSIKEATAFSLQKLLRGSVKQGLKKGAIITGAEMSTELLNAGLQTETQHAYAPEVNDLRFWNAIKQQMGSVFVASALFGTMGGSFHIAQNQETKTNISDKRAPIPQRLQSAHAVHQELLDQGQLELADVWINSVSEAIENHKDIPLDQDLTIVNQKIQEAENKSNQEIFELLQDKSISKENRIAGAKTLYQEMLKQNISEEADNWLDKATEAINKDQEVPSHDFFENKNKTTKDQKGQENQKSQENQDIEDILLNEDEKGLSPEELLGVKASEAATEFTEQELDEVISKQQQSEKKDQGTKEQVEKEDTEIVYDLDEALKKDQQREQQQENEQITPVKSQDSGQEERQIEQQTEQKDLEKKIKNLESLPARNKKQEDNLIRYKQQLQDITQEENKEQTQEEQPKEESIEQLKTGQNIGQNIEQNVGQKDDLSKQEQEQVQQDKKVETTEDAIDEVKNNAKLKEQESQEKEISKDSQQQEKIDQIKEEQLENNKQEPQEAQKQIEKAQEAATNPTNKTPEPTQAQIEAGNYKKGHIKIDGLDISVENPAGATRSGTDSNGKQWSVEMKHDYGYIKRTEGADGEQIDVFSKQGIIESPKVFIVDQVDPGTSKFDEHKVIMGAESEQEARQMYLDNYEKGWKGLGSITEMESKDFKEWVKNGKQNQPLKNIIPATETSVITQENDTTEFKIGDRVSWIGKEKKIVEGTIVRPFGKNKFLIKNDEGKLYSPALEKLSKQENIQDSAKSNNTNAELIENIPDETNSPMFHRKGINFPKNVDRFLKGKMRKEEALFVSSTPKVLQALNVKNFPVIITQRVMSKVIKGKHKDKISIESLKSLPEKIADPIMIFNSKTHPDESFVLMLDMKDRNGKTVIAPIFIEQQRGGLQVNSIGSIYGKDKNNWFLEQLKAGRALYINKTKSRLWLSQTGGLYLPKVRETINGFTKNILTEENIVKDGKKLKNRSEEEIKLSNRNTKGGINNGYEQLESIKAIETLHKGLEKHLDRKLPSGMFTVSSKATLRDSVVDECRKLAKIFGKEVVFFRNNFADIYDFNGVSFKNAEGIVFVNENTKLSHAVITGHELFHELKRDRIDLAQAFFDNVKDLISEDQYNQYAESMGKNFPNGNFTDQTIMEEFLADFVGEQMLTPEFWDSFYQRDVPLTKKIFRYIQKFFNKILNKGYKFTTTQFFRDIKTARDLSAQAFQKYNQSQPNINNQSIQFLQNSLEKYLNKKLPKDMFLKSSSISDKVNKECQHLANIFNKKIVFFENTRPDIFEFNGTSIKGSNNTIFINAQLKKPHQNIVAHELLHELRKDRPDLYKNFFNQVKDIASKKEFKQFAQKLLKISPKQLSTDKLSEEFLADFVGEQMTNPEFWDAFYHQDPSLFKQLYEFIKKFFNKLINNSYQYRNEAFFQDIKTARDEAARVMKKYANSQQQKNKLTINKDKTDQSSDQSDIMFSRNTDRSYDAFSDMLPPEVITRMFESKGIKPTSFKDALKKHWTEFKEQTEHFPKMQYIEDEKQRAILTEILRQHQEIPQIAQDKAARIIKDFIRNLDKTGYDAYAMNIILADEIRCIKDGLRTDENLPFGFTSTKQVIKAYEEFQNYAKQHPKIQEALDKRKQFQKQLCQDLVKYKILKPEALNSTDYFHHQIMLYWNDKSQDHKSTGTSSQDVRTHWRPWMAARKGSALDYNTEYIQAELTAIAQQLVQIETAKTLEKIKKEADILSDLKQEARKENIKKLNNLFKQKSNFVGPLQKFKEKITVNINSLASSLKHGKVVYDSEFQDVVDSILNNEQWKEKDGYDITHPRFFHFLSHLINKGSEGSQFAAGIYKAIQGREKFIKAALGENFLTYTNLIPKGYTTWIPNKNKGWFWANTITDSILQKLQTGEAILESKDVRQVLAKGYAPQWVIPEGLAHTLDNFRPNQNDTKIEAIAHTITSMWKQWILLNPYSLLRYNLNNSSGDLDIVLAAYPQIANPKNVKKAWQDLKQWTNHEPIDARLQKELDEIAKAGVIGSGFTVQEVDDILKIMSDDKFIKDVILEEKPNSFLKKIKGFPRKYWNFAKKHTTIRENTLRLATYRWINDQIIKKGNTNLYGAVKNIKDIQALMEHDPQMAVAKITRELLGDYGNISRHGEYIRSKILPFYSWLEINAPRYVYLMKNLKHEGGDIKSFKVKSAAIMTKRIGAFALKATALYGAIALYNAVVWPDEDEELRNAQRKQLHLILGKRKDGSIITLRFQGALSDALSFFGAEDLSSDIKDVAKGKSTIQEKAMDVPKALVSKGVNSLRPDVKGLFETLTGYSTYPDPLNPRPIRDKVENLLKTVKLDRIYKAAIGRPGKGGGDWAKQMVYDLSRLLLYEVDPDEQAYYQTRKFVSDWKKKQGIETSYGRPTKRGNALYYYKQALKYGDLEAAEKYIKKYYKLGGTPRGMKTSIRLAHPLSGISKLRRYEFRQTLSPSEENILKRGVEWYKRTYLAH